MDVVAGQQVNGCAILLFLLLLVRLQVAGLLSVLVHLDNLFGALCRDGLQVGSNALVGRVGDETSQDVGLEEVIVAVERLENNLAVRQFLAVLDIVVDLVVQTALQLGTHASQLLRIE